VQIYPFTENRRNRNAACLRGSVRLVLVWNIVILQESLYGKFAGIEKKNHVSK